MSDSQEKPWSDNPNAPQIPYYLYFEEKADFAGVLIGSILYGMHMVFTPISLRNHTHLVCSAYPRDTGRTFLPVYGRVA